MTVLTCTQVRELAPELALGVLTGAERAEAVAHVNDCTRCRNLLADLSGAADTLTLVVPEREPPAGFERDVLAAMQTRPRGARLRRVGALAIAAAVACIVTIVGVRVVDGSREPAPVVRAPVTPEVVAAPMVGSDDQVVGQVFATTGEHPWAYLFVEYGQMPAGSYRITRRDDSGSEAIGDMQVIDGRGFWGAPFAPPDGEATIALVAADGTTVCEGVFVVQPAS
jgi:Putative zinc-finger